MNIGWSLDSDGSVCENMYCVYLFRTGWEVVMWFCFCGSHAYCCLLSWFYGHVRLSDVGVPVEGWDKGCYGCGLSL